MHVSGERANLAGAFDDPFQASSLRLGGESTLYCRHCASSSLLFQLAHPPSALNPPLPSRCFQCLSHTANGSLVPRDPNLAQHHLVAVGGCMSPLANRTYSIRSLQCTYLTHLLR